MVRQKSHRGRHEFEQDCGHKLERYPHSLEEEEDLRSKPADLWRMDSNLEYGQDEDVV